MTIKAVVTLAVVGGLLAGTAGMSTPALFAERLAEFQATSTGIAVARTASEAAPGDAKLERTYEALSEHCENLADLYNVGAHTAAADFADSGLPDSVDPALCK